MKLNKPIILLCCGYFVCCGLFAQQAQNTELNQLIQSAVIHNKQLNSYLLQTESSKANIGTAYNIDKTTVYYGYDENNLAPNDRALKVLGIQQTFAFPTVYGARRNVYKSQWQQNKALYDLQKNQLVLNVSLVYDQIVYTQNKEKLYQHLDSLYAQFSKAGARKFELGETNYLEKITAEAKAEQIHTTLIQLQNQKKAFYEELKSLVQGSSDPLIRNNRLQIIRLDSFESGKELQKNYLKTISQTYASQLKLQNQNWLPDLSVQFFTGTSQGLGYHQNGFQIGVAVPLFFNSNIAKRKTARLEQQSWEEMRSNKEIQMETFYLKKKAELSQYDEMIKYYNKNGKKLSDEILKTAELNFKNGEIDFFQYIQSLENAINIQLSYLDNVLSYNKSYLELHYFNFNQ